tara:strand:- start:1200 stop:1388 length:189 start_codon:yes stop_codon:yes gene_type:complete
MEIIALVITGIIVAAAYMHGHKTGVKNGADAMYSHLYNQGIRKGDEVIVHLEYEDRSGIKEF